MAVEIDNVIDKIKSKGFPIPAKPTVDSQVVFNRLPMLTDLGAKEVGELYVVATAWLNYADWLLGQAKSELVLAERDYNLVANRIFATMGGDWKTQTEKKAARDIHPEVQEMEQMKLQREIAVNQLYPLRDSFHRACQAVSREISRRKELENPWDAGRRASD